jgi:methylated-DNA-protein-cysteine methyltransferase-like protein
MPSDFYQQVYRLVKSIPKGKVATYGQVSALLGKPRGARLVGWALNACPADVPWQRVINRHGMISIENMRASQALQAKLLKDEKVTVIFKDGNWWVDLNKFGWKMTATNHFVKTKNV